MAMWFLCYRLLFCTVRVPIPPNRSDPPRRQESSVHLSNQLLQCRTRGTVIMTQGLVLIVQLAHAVVRGLHILLRRELMCTLWITGVGDEYFSGHCVWLVVTVTVPTAALVIMLI